MESSIAWRFFNIARRRAIFTPCISCFATIQSFAKAACFTACLLISDCLDFFISSDRRSSRINLWRKLFLLQLSLRLYLVQLIVNILWPLCFFTFGFYLVAFLWLLILWILAFITMILFFREYFISGLLFVPYFLWITFAGYLNFGVWLLNNWICIDIYIRLYYNDTIE